MGGKIVSQQLQKQAQKLARADKLQRVTDKATVLEHLSKAHTLAYAAAQVGVRRQMLDFWRHEDAEFNAAVEYALRESAGDVYEEHLLTQSKKGIPTSTIVGLKMKKRFIEETKVTTQSLNLDVVADLRREFTLDELKTMLQAVREKGGETT